MNKFIKMLIIVVVIAAFSFPASAKEPDNYTNDFENILPDSLKDKLGEDGAVSLVGFDALISEISCAFTSRRGEIFSFLLLLFGGALLLFAAGLPSGELSGVCEAAVGSVISVLIFTRLGSIFAEISESLSDLSSFFSAFLPIAMGVNIASGGVNSAIIQNSGTNITLWLLGGLGNSFFISVVGFGLAMSLITAIGDETSLGVARGVKNFFVFCVGCVSAVLGATISLQAVVASAQDSAALRAARFAATGFIPVVGAAVSGALSTIVSGLTYARGIIGAGGIAVIVTMALTPLLILLLYRISFAAVISFSEFCGRGTAVRIFSAFKFSLDSMIALYTMSVLIYIIEMIVFMKGGAGG